MYVANLINGTVHSLEYLLPKFSTNHNKRDAPLGFIGDLASSLFGVATTKQLNTVIHHINNIYHAEGTLSDQFAKTTNQFHSYMSINDKRIDHLVHALSSQRQQLVSLLRTSATVEYNLVRSSRALSLYIQTVYSLTQIASSLQLTSTSLHALVHSSCLPY